MHTILDTHNYLMERCSCGIGGVHCYGSRMLTIWLTYSIFVSAIICVLPLYILKYATFVDSTHIEPQSMFRSLHPDHPPHHKLNMPLSNSSINVLRDLNFHDSSLTLNPDGYYKTSSRYSALDGHQAVDENKTGFDLFSIGKNSSQSCLQFFS